MDIVFPEDVWLVGYRTEIVDEAGKVLPRELQCHTFLGSSMPVHHHNQEVIGLFSDGYTKTIELPDGFGLFFKGGSRIVWDSMFNNRTPHATSAAFRIELRVISASALSRPLKPLRTTFRTVRDGSDLYFVGPGHDERETDFSLPPGRIHLIGTHIHPFGTSIELIDLRDKRTVWRASGAKDESGKLVSMPLYRNPEGYPVTRENRFRLRAVYDNPTSGKADAMAGVFVLYAPETP